MARKRVLDDKKLLANRIKLLQNEEGKARKKINETKKKAKDISGMKARNSEMLRRKTER